MIARRLLLFAASLALSASAHGQLCAAGKWVPSDSAELQNLGTSVAASGTLAVVGAPYDDSLAFSAGAAYVLEYTGGEWIELQKLTAFDAAGLDRFGRSVAIDGETIVVGSRWDDEEPPGTGLDSGSAYVFERVSGSWVLANKLIGSDVDASDAFGGSVAVSGDTIVVGADNEEGGAGGMSGAVYVFERGPTAWEETQKLQSPDATTNDFGRSVAIAGGVIAVGAPFGVDPVSGSVFVYEDSPTGWVFVDELTPLGGDPGVAFGRRVELDGDTLLAGGDGDLPIHSFVDSGVEWVLEDTFARESNFSFAGDRCLVGGVPVNVFERVGSTWTFVGERLSPDWHLFQLFGDAVAVGPTDLVTAPGDNEAAPNAGALFSFDGEPPVSIYCFCTSTPCGNVVVDAGCRHSAALNSGARLEACGSSSVSSDDLVLTLSVLVPNQFGILFMGSAPLSPVPFGDGLRCVGGPELFRFPVRFSGPGATFEEGPGLVQLSQQIFPASGWIDAGETWYFQGWYRDPAGPCGTGFNLSNAISVSFGP